MYPDGWQEVCLGSVSQIVTGGTPSRSVPEYWGGCIPWMSSGEINQRVVRATEEHITSSGMANSNARWLAPGTIMIALNGQGKTRGKVALLGVEATCNQSLAGIIPETGQLLSEYAFYYLDAQYQAIRHITGDDARNGLNLGILRGLRIILPPIDEQWRIAEVLRSVDEAITAAQNVAQQAQTVWHGLTETLIWDRLLNSPEVAQPLGSALKRSDYGVNAALGNEPTGYAVLRMGNLQDGWIDPTELKWADIGEAEAKALALNVGDILFNRTNSRDLVGKVALVREPTDFLYASYLVRLRADQSLADPYYLYAVMHSRRSQARLKNVATPGVSQSNINPTNLKKQVIPLPSLADQRDIGVHLQSVERTQRTALEELATLRQIKSDLMSDLLSGRVRVPAPTPSAVATRSVPPAFKRAVFAAEIVHQLHNDNRFGSVKHEKIVHLCELHLGLQDDLDRHAYKEAAGPYDPKAHRSTERIFKQQKWFDASKRDGKRVLYTPLEKVGSHSVYYDRYFGNQKAAVQSIIDLLRPLDTERCEIIATLYAVWNDFLIDGHEPTDDEIVASVLNDWHPSKKQIAESRWRAALPWMRRHDLVPTGRGEKTRVAKL